MLCAFFLRFTLQIIPVTKGQQDFATYVTLLPIVTVVFPLAFAVQGLYRIRPTRSKTEEWLAVGIGAVVATIVLSGVLLWLRPGNPDVVYSRATLGIFLGCALVRAIVEGRHRAGKDLDRVLVAGSGDLARAVVERMNAHRDELGFRIAGYLGNGEESKLDRLPCLGAMDEAERVVREHQIDHVFVALPHASSEAMTALLDRLMRVCLSIHVVPDLLQFMVLRSHVEEIAGPP